MFGTYFYNETIKRAVSIFGTLFNNITLKKIKSDGTVVGQQIVPISYGPKQKWLERITVDPKERDGNITGMTFPRMAFQLTGFEYDASRQQNKLIRHSKSALESDGVKRGYQYNPAPYTLNFTLSVLTKNMNDALQIVEQILPYFQPEYTVTMKMIDSMSDHRDVPIILNSISFEDNYESGYEERRFIEYTLEFKMNLYFFGPVYTGSVIKNVIERDYINSDNGGFTSTQIQSSGLVKEVKHYEPAFEASNNTAVSNSSTVNFSSAINSKISVNDEVFNTGNTPNPTITSIASDKLSMVLSSNITIDANTKLLFVGSVDPGDTFVVAETVSFYDDGGSSTFTEDTTSDAS